MTLRHWREMSLKGNIVSTSWRFFLKLMDELRSIKIVTSQDLDANFIRAEQLRSNLAGHKEPASGRQCKDIIMGGILDEYPDVPFTTRRYPEFSVYCFYCIVSAL